MPDRPAIFDVAVIGAGPAGAEAALAAAEAGAHTLCLAINLDTAGFTAGGPCLAAGESDPRRSLLEEMDTLGAALPRLLATGDNAIDSSSRLLADRRNLGLAYKEKLENTPGLEPRQALVVSIEATAAGWSMAGKLGESFQARTVVVATGTFLQGVVSDGGPPVGGGRRGEIPANAVAESLQNMGIMLVEAEADAAPRVDGRRLKAGDGLLSDDARLGELYDVSAAAGDGAWRTRPATRVRHLMLAAGQVGQALESTAFPGLFFAGRAAGGSGYLEAAALGVAAGIHAAAVAKNETGKTAAQAPVDLINYMKCVTTLCQDIASADARPVSARQPA